MPSAFVNGVNIYYEIHGSGFPLVLAYGLGGSTTRWADQVEDLSQHHQLILWDPRGHGKSDCPAEAEKYSMWISAEDLHGLLDHLDIQRAYVGGLSMGGGIAARYAVTHPERVAALLIIDSSSAAGVPLSDSMRAMREKTIQLTETEGMSAVADFSIETNPNLSTQAGAGAEAVQGLRQMYLDLDPKGYANTVRSMLVSDFPTEKLADLTMPTLVMVGEHDPARNAAQLTHTKIQGSQYVVIPGAGHLSNLDKPEEFNNHISEFLQKVESGIKV